MGQRNYLIEGVSGTGKTSVCHELRRRGHHALNTDRDLAYKGDPATGARLTMPPGLSEEEAVAWVHRHQIWDVDQVRAIASDKSAPMTFFCGGSRNFPWFLDLFDQVFVLDIDRATLERRLTSRPEDEFGGRPVERAFILRLHSTREDIPNTGQSIDATRPLDQVVDSILAQCAPQD